VNKQIGMNFMSYRILTWSLFRFCLRILSFV